MKSFTSSAINKSGKKFAPKAPSRRPAPASTTAAPVSKPKPDEGQNAPPTTSQPGANAAAAAALAVEPSIEHPNESQLPLAVESPAPSLVPTSEQPKTVSSVPAVKPTDQPSATQTKRGPVGKAIPIPIPTAKPRRPAAAPPAAAPTPTVEATSNKFKVSSTASETIKPSIKQSTDGAALRERDINNLGQAQQVQPDGPISQQVPVAQDQHPVLDESTEDVGTDHVDTDPALENPPRAEEPSVTPDSGEASHVEASGTAVNVSKKGRKPAIAPRKTKRTGAEQQVRKPRAKRKREPTPEESEAVEIAPTVIKMSELCRDLRTGKKSKREQELRNLESAEAERKQKAKDEARNSVTTDKQQSENNNGASAESSAPTPQNTQAGPRMRIVNGEIVIDNESLQVDRRADLESSHLEDVVESRLSRKINQASYGKRTKAESWDEELTDLFYRGLRMFGTDFMMISKMFPGRSRRQIKLKFNNEERRDPERIKRTLMGPSEAVDLQAYSEMTNTVYADPQIIQQELDEDKKRIEEQHAREKLAQEELLRNPGGLSNDANVAESIEKPASHNPRARPKKRAPSKNEYYGKEEIIYDF